MPGELLVKFKKQATRSAMLATLNKVSVQRIGTYKTTPRLSRVRIAPGVDVAEAMAAYRGDPNVEYVEPNYVYSIATIPNDVDFPQQWGLHNTGQQGIADADIDAPEAWDITTGSDTVVVAVIDSGVDYTHPDLAANIYTNTGDCDVDGNDDDANGYVDDCHGIDTVNDDSDPADDEGHGTHVAGILGAVGNNGIGISGVAWNVRILPCKFIGADGFGTAADAIECLDYIVQLKQRGVNIVATNNSWGGIDNSQALRDAIVEQREQGILFMVAAGNSGDNIDFFPEYPCSIYSSNVICVAWYTALDFPSGASNIGNFSVHVGAPGESILSTLPGNAYGTNSGTSMSTPFVSGVAALLAAQNPARNWIEIRNLVLSSGERNINLDPALQTVTKNRVNASSALACVNKVVSARVSPRFRYREMHRLGEPLTLAALHINCAVPAGPITVSIAPSGETIVLADDGAGVDDEANDGVYSAQWTPQQPGLHILDFEGTAPGTNEARVVVDRDLKPGFPAKTLLSGGSYSPPLHLTVGDISGDSRLEIMSTGLSSGPQYVWDTDGNEVSGWPRLDSPGFPELRGAAYSVLAQLDPATARRELFVSHYGGEIAGYRPDATHLPGWPRTLGARLGLQKHPVAFDLDGDGTEEVFVYDSGDVHVLRANGTEVTGWLPYEGWPPSIGDLDGDEVPEIVYTDVISNGVFEINARRRNGTSLPGFPVSYDLATDMPMIGDLDGDGRNEIVFASSAGVSSISGEGVLAEVVPTLWPTFLIDNSTAALGDLDGDGVPEIVLQASHRPGVGYSHVTVFAWHGTGEVVTGFPIDLGEPRANGESHPIIADADNDGAADIVLTVDSAGNVVQGWLYALKNDATIIDGFPKELSMGSSVVAAVADIDLNGLNDIVVGSSAWEGVQGLFDGVWAFEVDGPVDDGPVEWGQHRGDSQHHTHYELGKNLPQHAFIATRVRGSGSITGPGLACGDDCIERVAKGADVTLTATPVSGATFNRWLGACAGQGNPCTVDVSRFRSVVAEFIGTATLNVAVNGAGTVTSDPSGISCPSDCTEGLDAGSTVELTATPSASNEFVGWSGACSGSVNTCTLTMNAVQSVTATFAPRPALTVTSQGSGAVTSQPAGINCPTDCGQTYARNTSVTLTATPAADSQFSGWSGACSGTANTCTVVMDAAKTVTAIFTLLPHVSVTMQGTGTGVVTSEPGVLRCPGNCAEPFAPNTVVTLTAAANPGSQFTGWTGACSGSAATCTLTMSTTRQVTARFQLLPDPVLTVASLGTGTGTIASNDSGISCGSDCSQSYSFNTSVTLTATPASDSTFTGWTGACTGTGACTVTMNDSQAVNATFTVMPMLSVTVSGSGSVTSNPSGISCGTVCSQAFQPGATVTLTAAATSGNEFNGWSGACAGQGSTCSITMDAAKSAQATFRAVPPSGGGSSGGGGGGGGSTGLLGTLMIGVLWLARFRSRRSHRSRTAPCRRPDSRTAPRSRLLSCG